MKQFLSYISVLVFLVCFMSVPAGAFPIMDAKSDANAIKQQAQSLAGKANEAVIQKGKEQSQKAEHGNAACDKNPEKSKNKKAFITTEAYEYIYDNVLDEGDDEADVILKPNASYLQNRMNVKKKFFAEAKTDSGLTDIGEKVNVFTKNIASLDMSQKGLKTSDVRKVMELRQEYASEVAAKNLKISLDLREKVIKDIESTMKAETSGCNQLQGLLMENRNLAALVKETATDVVVQILTLESLGSKMLLKEEAGLISVPKKPKDN